MHRGTYYRRKIGRTNAVELGETEWWKFQPAKAVALFQLHTDELCMPFRDFQNAVSEACGRGVFTHEFVEPERRIMEIVGNGEYPTSEEIASVVPEPYRTMFIQEPGAPCTSDKAEPNA